MLYHMTVKMILLDCLKLNSKIIVYFYNWLATCIKLPILNILKLNCIVIYISFNLKVQKNTFYEE